MATAPTTGNRSSAVMQQRAPAPDSLDYFPTPPWATRALCEFILRNCGGPGRKPLDQLTCWEPACGEGHMARPLAEYFAHVIASDVHRYHPDHAICDFLLTGTVPFARPDWIISNPPFVLAEQFIRRAIATARCGVAMLLRSSFRESAERYHSLFGPMADDRPSYTVTFAERVVMLRGRLIRANEPDPFNLDEHGQPRKASTATSYDWYIWLPGQQDTRQRWIGPCRQLLERDGDYPAYPDQWAAIRQPDTKGALL